MEKLYEKFLAILIKEDKERAVKLILNEVSKISEEVKLVELYNKVLERSLNDMTCNIKEQKLCIWREHIRSSIIRTILECCYPEVIRIRDANHKGVNKGKVAVICPEGEYHEIGARMVSDFFTLSGYHSTYVGSSMPKDEFILVINEIHPDILAISVTNYYNLVSTKKTIEAIRKNINYPITIIVGGNAFSNNSNSYKEIGADALVNDYNDILNLRGEVI